MLLECGAMAIPTQDFTVGESVTASSDLVMCLPSPTTRRPTLICLHQPVRAANMGMVMGSTPAFASLASSLPSSLNGFVRESHLSLTSLLAQIQVTFLTLFLASWMPLVLAIPRAIDCITRTARRQ